jgi:hypothetical protein
MNLMKTCIIFALTFIIACSVFAEQVLYYSGTVRYPSGAPAVGVRVQFYPGFYTGSGKFTEVKTDINGHYEIIQHPEAGGIFWGHPNPTNSIMARDWERNLAVVQEFVGNSTNTIDLILRPGITLTGSVKNTEGAPVSGAEAELRFFSGDSLALLEPLLKMDALGSFSAPALPQGRDYVVWEIKAKGYGSSNAWVRVKNTQTNSYEFPIFILKSANQKLAGVVTDDLGRPLARTEVRFSGTGQPADCKTNADSQGRFVFDAVCGGKVYLSALWSDEPTGRHLSYRSSMGMSAQAGDTNIILKLFGHY